MTKQELKDKIRTGFMMVDWSIAMLLAILMFGVIFSLNPIIIVGFALGLVSATFDRVSHEMLQEDNRRLSAEKWKLELKDSENDSSDSGVRPESS